MLAKNDPLDARMIASFVAIMPTRPAQRRAPAAERLAEMLAVRRQLSAEKVAAENASRLLEDAMLQRLSRRRIARLAADIDLLDAHLVHIVETDATLERRYRLLTSMPGVGAVLACTLIALLPELGRRMIGALSRGAQKAFESAFKFRRYATIRCWLGRVQNPKQSVCEGADGRIDRMVNRSARSSDSYPANTDVSQRTTRRISARCNECIDGSIE